MEALLFLWPVWLVFFLGCLFRLLWWPRLPDGDHPAPVAYKAVLVLAIATGLLALAGIVKWLFFS